MMKNKTNMLILLAGLSLFGAQANAQPGAGGPGGGQGGGRRGQGGRGGGMGMMTPQQMQQMREEALKAQMTTMGVPEAAQTTILAYATARETAAMPLRAQARTLQEGLNNNISAEVAARQLAAMRDAIKVEKDRRTTAQTELDTAVGFSKNPQLEAFLTLSGLIGDESSIIAPAGGGGGRGGFGGRGGRGGRGGGQGGPGQGGPGGGGDAA